MSNLVRVPELAVCACSALIIDFSLWEILQEKVYRTRINDVDLSTTPLNGCCNDDVIQLGPLRSQSLFQFV